MNHTTVLFGFLFLAATTTANALTFSFSFTDDPAAYLSGRTHVGGTVTGLIFGLDDNTNNQIPSSFQITSDVSSLGIATNNLLIESNSLGVHGGSGFDVSGSIIVYADFAQNFNIGHEVSLVDFRYDYQIRFNFTNFTPDAIGSNALLTNVACCYTVIGNASRFAGASYDVVQPVPVFTIPLPPTAALFAGGLGALSLLRRWRKRKA
jgi:hypothetical protein